MSRRWPRRGQTRGRLLLPASTGLPPTCTGASARDGLEGRKAFTARATGKAAGGRAPVCVPILGAWRDGRGFSTGPRWATDRSLLEASSLQVPVGSGALVPRGRVQGSQGLRPGLVTRVGQCKPALRLPCSGRRRGAGSRRTFEEQKFILPRKPGGTRPGSCLLSSLWVWLGLRLSPVDLVFQAQPVPG